MSMMKLFMAKTATGIKGGVDKSHILFDSAKVDYTVLFAASNGFVSARQRPTVAKNV